MLTQRLSTLSPRTLPAGDVYPELSDDLALCRTICHRHAKSFSAGIRFFPERVRDHTFALYGFVRLPDDIVDEEGLSDDEARQKLEAWIARWEDCLAAGGRSEEPVFRAMAWTLRECRIPHACIDAFFAAMLADTRTKRYRSVDALRGYMHGSAAVVGEVMAHIFGVHDEETLRCARALGEAFQMTNFLRDIDADWRERGRVYLPLDDLARFGLTDADVARRRATPAWRALMRFEIAWTRALYGDARRGIGRLPEDCRFGVALAADIYEAILDRIEAVDGDVFGRRVRTSSLRKFALYGRRRLVGRRP